MVTDLWMSESTVASASQAVFVYKCGGHLTPSLPFISLSYFFKLVGNQKVASEVPINDPGNRLPVFSKTFVSIPHKLPRQFN